MSLKVGDKVELTEPYGPFFRGDEFVIEEVVDNPTNTLLRGKVRGEHIDVYAKRVKLVEATATYKLTHKTNGSTLNVTSDDYYPVVKNQSAGTFGALIEGTTEPVIQFKYSEWDVKKVEPPFVFPTGKNAVFSTARGSSYVRTPNGAWRNITSGAVYREREFIDLNGLYVVFPGE